MYYSVWDTITSGIYFLDCFHMFILLLHLLEVSGDVVFLPPPGGGAASPDLQSPPIYTELAFCFYHAMTKAVLPLKRIGVFTTMELTP